MAFQLVLLLYTLAICEGNMLVTEEPPVTLPPSGVLPPANLIDADTVKHHVCLPHRDEENRFRFGCGADTGVSRPLVLNIGVGGWSSVFDNGTYCPVTNPECTVSQLQLVISCEFVYNGCSYPFYQTDIDVPGCTEPTNFVDIEFECPREEPKSACHWEGYSTAENLKAHVGGYNPNMCRCVITTPTGTGLSAYINITLVTTKVRRSQPDLDPEGNLFVQYVDDMEYETVLMSGLRRISMVENLLLQSDKPLILGINYANISSRMDIMFTYRASREIHMTCYDELTDMDSCSSNPCLNGGSCVNKPMGFECQCADGFMGQFCEIDIENVPSIENVNPLYGPIAGGTRLTVTGQHFPVNASAVLLGKMQCPIIDESSTEIVSLTPEVEESVVGMNLPVSVQFMGELNVTSDYDYTYRNNPIIESIHPLTTIKHGGTKINISGEYMNPVYKPVLEVTMVIRETTENDNGDFITTETHVNYTEVCEIGNENSDELICYTPAMDDIPDDILDLNNSRNCTQRNNPNVIHKIYENKIPDVIAEIPETEPAPCISVTFYLGMTLDGVNDYKNISEHPDISEYGTIKILPTPTFDIVSRVFERDNMETFEGDNLASIHESDYMVFMGLDDCKVIDLKDNALTCLPDQNFPTDGSKMKKQEFDIIVGIGTNLNATIGSMVNRPKLPFFVVGMVLAGVLILLAITLAIVFTKKKKQTKKQDTASDVIHLPDVPSSEWSETNEWSENNLDQSSSTFTNDSMGHFNMAELSDAQNNNNYYGEYTRQAWHIRNERCLTMDVPYEMARTPPPLPRREKYHDYENVDRRYCQ